MQLRISFRSRSDLVLDADHALDFQSDLASQACISFYSVLDKLGCRKWGCNKWGFKGCLAALPGNQPKSPFLCPFRPFPEGPDSTWEIPENGGKRPFSSDILGFA